MKISFYILIVASFILGGAIYGVQTTRAITCAPGDVMLDASGHTTDGTTKPAVRCLYGSEVTANRGFGSSVSDPRANIRVMINVAMGLLGTIVVIMIIYGGLLWITSAGREDQVTKGKHTLVWAAIGAVIVSIAWTITSYVLQVGRAIG
ncbi:MAG: hypothetical protein A2445_01295 [Candidatus Jacksonbacteria bacterium RIFOXYC2_FULL_44_29]|nr:MAG: hypothetical protein UW45_C0013G0022 [Parcubacteria group bacterium GW2011_GWC2_44_22]OGY74972.1 MAG: hypothetical protein A2240_05325 [Candidatus Jacksonbacteria bacterium RIFOXYA2_FULL_43_12]OGY76525.1 MAG: hypothetical protein A2295_02110 [Candidatus Jacksonbacteria bacterium RIFOXYB2_FULL_44_15]OGY78505.1 MAG: hypothetical protein A2445_01295 [Candidatus Jacksonbacteria bacterium RIFOXYC2_FULL_44_29]OGY81162.1 MAG: hypothetical protein A2550_01690 [Candidatus Jacksonbacteria bacteri